MLGEEVLLGSTNLVFAGAEFGRDECRFELGYALGVFIVLRAGDVQIPFRGDIGGEKLLLTLQLVVGEDERGSHFAELGFESLDFARALAGFGILQLSAGLIHPTQRLVARGAFRGFLQRKKQGAFFDFLAPLDSEVFHASAEGRSDMDELALDVALHEGAVGFFTGCAKKGDERKKNGTEKSHAAILSGLSTGRKRKLAWYFPP